MLFIRVPALRPHIGVRLFTRTTPALLFKQSRSPLLSASDLVPPTTSNGNVNEIGVDPTASSAPLHDKRPGDDPKYDNHKILKRVPRFLRPYTTQFIYAPVSHVTAFLILHELTAIVPLVGVWYALHQYHDVFMGLTLDLPDWALEKGTKVMDKVLQDWDFKDYSLNEKMQFITEGAYAYVIVKALFPVRLAVSLFGMPFFAKWFVLPFTRFFVRKKAQAAPAKQPDNAIQPHKVKKVKKFRI